MDGKAPMKHASGLATQHVCGNSIERLSDWHQVWLLASTTGTFGSGEPSNASTSVLEQCQSLNAVQAAQQHQEF